MTRLTRFYRRLLYGPFPTWAKWPDLCRPSLWARVTIDIEDSGEAKLSVTDVPGASQMQWAGLVNAMCQLAGEIGKKYGIYLEWKIMVLQPKGAKPGELIER